MATFSYFRIASPDRIRNVDVKHVPHAGGGWACKECGDKLPTATFMKRKVRPPVRCFDCGQQRRLVLAILSGRALAQRAVALMFKAGELPAVGTLACVDCARRAECWDHRDYNEPRCVVPVCRSCNVIRGHALPFNPYLVGLMLIEYFRQPAQSGAVAALPSTNISCARHGTDALSFAVF